MRAAKSRKHPASLEEIDLLWQALSDKVRPWVADTATSRCIVAAPTLRGLRSESTLPAGVGVTARAPRGRRIRVPKERQRIGSTMAISEWPEDGLLAKHTLQLACVIKGRSDFRVGDYILHVPAGHFIVVPPGVPQPSGARAHVEERGVCDILWLTLWNDVFRCWICHTRDEEHLPARHNESCFVREPRAHALFQALAEEAAAREAGFEETCSHLLRTLWLILHRRIGEGRYFQNVGFQNVDERVADSTESPITRAQHYIRAHLDERLSLADVAQRVYLSRAHFARRFHAESGETFIAFVTRCRLEEARRLLLETDWPISTVSEFTGITPTHLRTIFLRHEKQAPREFRRTRRGV
jgi:AraC-like DNA-binding protein